MEKPYSNTYTLLDRAFNLIDRASKYVLIAGVIFFISIAIRIALK